jgi:hypothetical protein
LHYATQRPTRGKLESKSEEKFANTPGYGSAAHSGLAPGFASAAHAVTTRWVPPWALAPARCLLARESTNSQRDYVLNWPDSGYVVMVAQHIAWWQSLRRRAAPGARSAPRALGCVEERATIPAHDSASFALRRCIFDDSEVTHLDEAVAAGS